MNRRDFLKTTGLLLVLPAPKILGNQKFNGVYASVIYSESTNSIFSSEISDSVLKSKKYILKLKEGDKKNNSLIESSLVKNCIRIWAKKEINLYKIIISKDEKECNKISSLFKKEINSGTIIYKKMDPKFEPFFGKKFCFDFSTLKDTPFAKASMKSPVKFEV